VQVHALGKSALRVGAGSVATTLLTLVCYRTHIDLASAIPLYLVLVVLHSLAGDFWSSAILAVLATACLDFFFTPPLFSLRMTNPLNGLALMSFVATALVITKLVARVREEAKSATLQKERLDRLYQLSQQLLGLDPEVETGESFLGPFQRLFGVTAISVFDAATAEVHTIGESPWGLADKTREAYIRGQDLNDSRSHTAVRCLRVAGKMTGAIGFEGLQEAGETVGSLTALTATLIERTQAFRRASAANAAAQTETYRSALLDALAHEFKTPLATILAAAGGIREAGPLGREQSEMAETVEEEAARLGKLTSRLLRTARLDKEQIKPRVELTDVTELIAHVASQYAARSQDRRIVLAKNDAVQALADPALLRLVLNQLIENACKYSQAGSTVSIEIQQQTDFVTVRVSNSGSSIPFHERGRIFDRFYRGEEAKRSTSGSGLGLYVARKIALAHGGDLDLEAGGPPGDGVTFCLKIPCGEEESEHALTAR
jgi:two-component system, OmpR family, sensor histidine kinase KdpD